MSIGSVRPATVYRPTAARPVAAGGPTTVTPAPVQSASQGAHSGSQQVVDLVGNQNHVAGLFKMGINTPGKLRFWAGGGLRRFFASIFTGVPQSELIKYGQRADLMRVPDMRPQWARLLHEAGIKSPAQLANYGGKDVGTQIQRGILYGTLVAKAIELSGEEGRIFEPPGYDRLEKLAQHSVGLGTVIQVGQPQ